MKLYDLKMNYYLLASVIALASIQTFAQTITSASTGISATVTAASGVYAVTSTTPPWTFSGTLGRALAGVTTVTATDSVGSYQELQFAYTQTISMRGAIRVYQSVPVVLFSKTFVAAVAAEGTKFPVFTTYPQGLYVQGYASRWGTYQFALASIENTSPAVFFDANRNAFIISPASCFMDAEMTYSASSITSGLQSYAANFPAGFDYTTALIIQPGINAAFDTWGRSLTALNGKTRPKNDADVSLEKCGYWTDNKATYYYTYNTTLGYEGTLIAVKKGFDSAHISLGYMQLDSWFYPKGPEQSWDKGTGSSDFANGCWVYRAHPTLFPKGLADFKQRLGIPLITHGRWFSNTSPYLSTYQNSYTSSYGAIIDSVFWDTTVAKYLEQSGVEVYEQDWLDNFAKPAYTLNLGEQFMTTMARGMQKHNITMQYCMVIPRHYLQASKYSNVTTMRISQDGFDLSDRDQIFYLSRVARSVGTYPWTDGFSSSDLSKMTVAVLTAGVIGFIDAIGAQNNANILQAVRRDGVIVKPDVPITATDETYINHASSGGNSSTAPMVGVTYSDFDRTRVQYVFAYNRSGSSAITFNPDRYGLSGTNAYAYNYRTAAGSVLASGAALTGTVTDWSYYILSPVGPSGVAFLGDKGKIASCGKKRISSLIHSANQVSVSVAIEPQNSTVTLFGYAATRPSALVGANGRLGTLSYSTTTHIWNVAVTPTAATRSSVVEIPVYIGNSPIGVKVGKTPAQQDASTIRLLSGRLCVTMQDACNFSVRLFDITGRLRYSENIRNKRTWTLPSTLIMRGTYVVRVDDNASSLSKKIVLW